MFVGLSVKGALTPEMVRSMAPAPIVFAMANPNPEIQPELVEMMSQSLPQVAVTMPIKSTMFLPSQGFSEERLMQGLPKSRPK